MIIFVEGDATKPTAGDIKVICHVCNDVGAWGSGFVLAVDRISSEPREYYKKQAKHGRNFGLGQVQWSFITPELAVVNMVAQHGLKSASNPKPIDEKALYRCLRKVNESCKAIGTDGYKKKYLTIHMPRIGSDRGGGDWNFIEGVIDIALSDWRVFVYTLPAVVR